MSKLKMGLFGVGHLGKIHLNCLLATSCWEVAGFYDPDDRRAEAISAQYGIARFKDVDALLTACDAADIVTPTPTHFALASRALRAGKHVFVEKPLTESVPQGRKLLRLSQETGLKVQVGHVERFNPAYLALKGMELRPMFIEVHRLAGFNPRGADVSVILDLMIHDLDLALCLAQSPVTRCSADGVSVLSDTLDIANVRIEFANGCVANLTASRMSLKQMRKMRLFQKDHYISLDFLEKNAQIVRLYTQDAPDLPNTDDLMQFDTPGGQKWMRAYMPEIEPVNAIKMELEKFHECIAQDSEPAVPLTDGLAALELAHRILRTIRKKQQKYEKLKPLS